MEVKHESGYKVKLVVEPVGLDEAIEKMERLVTLAKEAATLGVTTSFSEES